MDNFQIETAQNVNIVQNAAGVGERILAYLVDLVIIIIYIICISLLISAVDMPENVWVISIIIGLPIFLYNLLWEMFWNGRTPGKAALKIRVVKMDGSKPAFSNYLLRWVMRIIEITGTLGGLAIVTILLNGKGQRLGDLAATTTVITEKQIVNFGQTVLVDIPQDYIPEFPQVTVFSDSEMQTIKNVFMEARINGNHNVILRLSKKVSKLMDVKYEGTPITFVDKVIKDYNFYTQNM